MPESTFPHTIGGKSVVLTRATFACDAEVDVTDTHRIVKITFHPKGRKQALELWFTFTGEVPPRSLSGSRVKTSLELCSKPQNKRPAMFLFVVLDGELIPLHTSHEKALDTR